MGSQRKGAKSFRSMGGNLQPRGCGHAPGSQGEHEAGWQSLTHGKQSLHGGQGSGHSQATAWARPRRPLHSLLFGGQIQLPWPTVPRTEPHTTSARVHDPGPRWVAAGLVCANVHMSAQPVVDRTLIPSNMSHQLCLQVTLTQGHAFHEQ